MARIITGSERGRESFMRRISVYGENDCWIWQGSVNRYGYPYFEIKNKIRILAHRFMYVITYKTNIEDVEIHHRCEIKRCLNPKHLEALTKMEHVRAHPLRVGPHKGRYLSEIVQKKKETIKNQVVIRTNKLVKTGRFTWSEK
jgi:hypothetical protein